MVMDELEGNKQLMLVVYPQRGTTLLPQYLLIWF
jgi:hypothetical protein